MRDYTTVRDNIILGNGTDNPYHKILVVSAYAGTTDQLLEHKKTGRPGIYALFANADDDVAWEEAYISLQQRMLEINHELFDDSEICALADQFILKRLEDVKRCLTDLQRLCEHGFFNLESHLGTVREMLASLGEAHSAWNTAQLLRRDGIKAKFIDLTGWDSERILELDEKIMECLADSDLDKEISVVPGYTHCQGGMLSTFGRGYSEMTFSRIAVLTQAKEAIIHKEYHLSSADPRVVGEECVVPIGRTNYDVADQLANLGMEAIHPRAAKGLRQNNIPLRVKNTFEPEHQGTLITQDYISESPCVEIIAGRKHIYAVEVFDQEMMGHIEDYDSEMLRMINRFKGNLISKDNNANTLTHFINSSLKIIKRLSREMEKRWPEAEINIRKVAIVSAIGSDMKVPGMLAKSVNALAKSNISILAMHQSMRQVDMQFIVDETDYETAIQCLHKELVEAHDHGLAICAA